MVEVRTWRTRGECDRAVPTRARSRGPRRRTAGRGRGRTATSRRDLVRAEIQRVRVGPSARASGPLPAERGASDSTIRCARSSWSPKTSSTVASTVCDQTRVPAGASTSCVVARSARRRAAMCPEHGVDLGLRAIARQVGCLRGETRGRGGRAHHDRVEPRERRRHGVGQANARKSTSGSGRSTRNGSTMTRVSGRATEEPPGPGSAAMDSTSRFSSVADAAAVRRPLGERAVQHAVDRDHRRRADERGPSCSWRSAPRPRSRPSNAGRPATVSNTIAATENRSVRVSTSPPRTCSGAMYRGVPRRRPVGSDRCLRRSSGKVLRQRAREAEVEELHAVRA